MINNGKLVSIIVPIYNSARYLRSCVDSLLAQTYGNVEIILVDDGSSDESGHICDQYGQMSDRIRVFHKENGGVSSARNLGIEQARGEYLMFVDSDDIIHPELAEIYVQAADSDKTVLCNISIEKKALDCSYLNEWQKHIQQYQKNKFMQFYYADYVNSPCDKFYDAGIIREQHIRFDESMSLGEDMMFNLEYFKYAPPMYKVVQCPLYYYRQGQEESLVNSYRPELFELQQYMLKALGDFLKQSGSWDEGEQNLYYRLAWNRLYLTAQIYQSYLRRGKTDIKKIVRTSLKDPFWKEIEQECWKRGLMNWKSILKKMHMELLKRW